MQEAVSRSRYLVRRLEPSDSASFFGAVRASLPGLVDAMPWCRLDYAIEDAEAWIRFTQSCWENRSEFPLGVFEAETGQVIGGVGVNQINHAHRIGNIGYWVSTPHHGRGIARFAAREAAMLGFGELGLARLEELHPHGDGRGLHRTAGVHVERHLGAGVTAAAGKDEGERQRERPCQPTPRCRQTPWQASRRACPGISRRWGCWRPISR